MFLKGNITGESWFVGSGDKRRLYERSDPYFIWFDWTRNRVGSASRDVPVHLPVHLLVEIDDAKRKLAQPRLEALDFKGRFGHGPDDMRPTFLTGSMPFSSVFQLCQSVHKGDVGILRFELAMAQFRPRQDLQPAALALGEMPPDDFEASVRNHLSELRDLSASPILRAVEGLASVFRRPGRKDQSGSISYPNVPSGQPLVVVVDDFCNFSSPLYAGRLRTLWDQGKQLRPRKKGEVSQDPYWEPAHVPDYPHDKAAQGDEGGTKPLRCEAEEFGSGYERYGAILNFFKDAKPLVEMSGEFDAYRRARYPDHRPPQRLSHGAAVMFAIAARPNSARRIGSLPAASAVAGAAPIADPDGALATPGPDAIHFVQLPERSVADTSGGSLAAFAIDAIHRATGRAVHACRPAVIVNLSYGTHSGPHDGSSMFECAVLEMLNIYDGSAPRRPALHVVMPAGNSHLWRCHSGGWISPGAHRELLWRILPDDETDSFLEIWFGGGADVEVTATSPTGEVLRCTPGQAKTWPEEAEGVDLPPGTVRHAALIYPSTTSRGKNGTMALLAVAPTRRSADGGVGARRQPDEIGREPMQAPAGVWKVSVRNCGDGAVNFHAWVQREDAAPVRGRSTRGYLGRQSYLLDPDPSGVSERGGTLSADPRFTLNGIATASHADRRLWVVGAMDEHGRLSRYSAAGPDRMSGDRVQGADAVTTVDRSRNHSGRLVGGVLSGSRVRLQGTSIGAAIFTRLLHHALTRVPSMNWLTRGPAPDDAVRLAGEPEMAYPFLRGGGSRLRHVDDIAIGSGPRVE